MAVRRRGPGIVRANAAPVEMMHELAKRTGGIPDFAKEILKQHLPPDEVESADRDARAKRLRSSVRPSG